MVFRYLLPAEPPPLPVYVIQWRLINGVLNICDIFPALLLAGLVIPFGWIAQDSEPFPRFSLHFFKWLSPALFTGFAAAAVYAVVFFLVSPLSQNYYKTLSSNGTIFHQSKAAAAKQASAGEWLNAEHSLAVCKRIWRKSAEEGGEIFSLAESISVKATEIRIKKAALESEKIYNIQKKEEAPIFKLWEPVNAQEALNSANIALAENRYFDAHWLAGLVMQLLKTKQTGAEYQQAAHIARQAWNTINNLAPSEKERVLYSLYHQKRDGYAAIHDTDWLQAYHIFADLITKTPADPDVANFLALSKQEVESIAFFIEERDITLGTMVLNPLFSLPTDVQQARAVIRMTDLSLFSDCAYGRNMELLLFDKKQKFIGTISSPFCRISPYQTDRGERLLVMMRSISNETNEQFDPTVTWFDTDWKKQELFDDMQIVLNIQYHHFILLTNIRYGIDSLLLPDLFSASKTFGEYGYITQVFQAELMYRIFSLIVFLPATVITIVLGWRFRATRKPFFIGIPMFFILPFVFQIIIWIYQRLFNTLCIWSVTNFGFTMTGLLFGLGTVGLFFLSLLVAAFQRKDN
jgi:hypothetical protein